MCFPGAIRKMNSFKSKIIKSEAVKIIDNRAEELSTTDEPCPPPPRSSQNEEKQRLQAVIREAYDKGLAAGMQRGRDLRSQECASILKAAEEAMQQAGKIKLSIIEKSEEDILHLVLDIAEKVLHHEVTSNRDVAKNILKSAIQAMNDRENIRVHCHPADLAVLKEVRPEMMQSASGIGQLEFIEDNSVGVGGVRLETGFGEVEARIDKQFEVVKTALLS